MWPYMWAWKAEDIFLEWTHFLEDVHEFHKFLYFLHDTIQWSELNVEKSSHHISWCLFVNYRNPQQCTSNHVPQTAAPTSHPTSPLSLPLSGKELHTAPPTNCYKKNFNTLTPLSSQMAINTTSWRWIYTHNPQTQQPHLKITPKNLPSMPPTIHLLTIYSENCNQK